MRKVLYILCCIALFALPTFAQQRVVIGLTGDIMVGKSSATRGRAVLPPSVRPFFDTATPYLKDADITIGNLVSPFVDEDSPIKMRKGARSRGSFTLKTPVRYAKELKAAGFDIFTVANSHTMDFGEEGKKSTIRALQDAGIAFAGFNSGYEYATVVKNGIRIAVCAFGYGYNLPSINDIPKAVQLIRLLRTTHDVVIVSIHGGAEGAQYAHVPFRIERHLREQRGDVHKFAHACIDAGAAMVFGHGPHIPRAMELYNNHLIAYSLGNFCTPYDISMRRSLGYAPLLKVELDKRGNFLSGRIYSFYQKKGSGPLVDAQNRATKEIARLTKADFPSTELVIQAEGWLSHEEKNLKKKLDKNGVDITTDYDPSYELLRYARSLLGSRYVPGHSGNGMYDCSGFTRAVYSKIGYKLNPSSRAQYTQGRPIDTSSLRPGDLVFWRGSRRGGSIGHVGMVLEILGNGKFRFIHAANRYRGVTIDTYPGPYYSSHYAGARRVLP
jgi:cell wall-associated NlpC family hydrolase